MIRTMLAAALAMGLAATAPDARAQPPAVKIGILNDQTGVYSDHSGLGSVVAAQMAIDEFVKANPGARVELLSADHLNKPDVATSIARKWIDQDGVHLIADLQNSAISLAVQHLGNQTKRITIATSSVTPDLYGKACSPTGIHWAMDPFALAIGPTRALADKKKWFFLTVDLSGGHLFEEQGVAAVKAVGGEVVGRARHPLGSADMSSYLLNAQSLGAQVVGLANAGQDAIKSIKGANEFGLTAGGIKVAPLLFHDSDIKAVGLDQTGGMVIGTNYYWDLDEGSRVFGRAFFERTKKMPTDYQFNIYASVRHYLKGVAAAGTVDADKVMAKMRELPIELFGDKRGALRPDGRVVYDTYVMQVKTPAESKGEWDLLKQIGHLPADKAFRPASETECPAAKAAR
ncbi:ABC transporter substrate-binding protein [Enterovirga rhinocerotis]|uniref:Branched-chain amino acid transport system substrate-binding protein n=1 Tax=Enterovirga rhinocerotis TaxID=1339210 RepID=A0A4R7BR06_9HYPH|nr:ABC transporter substrate-binding protein [Enterovirga rhinocerotis]TDR88068.1 branched-chain amino acid transport system substrate-binding protein [Enterovirga rhinocerotis]